MFPIVGWKSAELKIPGEREGEGGGGGDRGASQQTTLFSEPSLQFQSLQIHVLWDS